MGLRMLLGFLGLQLCLFCSAHGSDAGSRTLLQHSRLDRRSETQHGPLLQAEVPEFGLGLKYLAPQDPHVILMKLLTRERRQTERKKKKKSNPGAYSLLALPPQPPLPEQKTPAISRTKRQHEAKTPPPPLAHLPPHQGQGSALEAPQVHRTIGERQAEAQGTLQARNIVRTQHPDGV